MRCSNCGTYIDNSTVICPVCSKATGNRTPDTFRNKSSDISEEKERRELELKKRRKAAYIKKINQLKRTNKILGIISIILAIILCVLLLIIFKSSTAQIEPKTVCIDMPVILSVILK